MKYWVFIIVVCAGCVGQTQVPSETPGPEPKAHMYTEATTEEIYELVNQVSPVVMYVYSPTCSSCNTVKPLVQKLHDEYQIDIIWVNKMENQEIFDEYNFFYYPALYVDNGLEVLVAFDENDSLTWVYSQILDGTITGMKKIGYTIDNDNEHITICMDDLTPDTIYYIEYETHRVFILISSVGNLFVFSGSENCETNWLYMKKGLLYDGENKSQWEKDTLAVHGGACGGLVLVPYTISGAGISIAIKDITQVIV
ncbi:MAG: thioredoxin family protein [Candidatus Methanofastidiosia archaeon]|jgi:thiol-disulfide isomerase/thioredoxin